MKGRSIGQIAAQVRGVREAGQVTRCHIFARTGPYNLAHHCYGALSLLLLTHPNPSLRLIRAIAWHDVAERWLGDIPATAKWGNEQLARVYENEEDWVLNRLGLAQNLDQGEIEWLRAVDTMDLWLWGREEQHRGNHEVDQLVENCQNVIEERNNFGKFPTVLMALYIELVQNPQKRFSDSFRDLIAAGGPFEQTMSCWEDEPDGT